MRFPRYFLNTNNLLLFLFMALFCFIGQIRAQNDEPRSRDIVPVFETTRPPAPKNTASGSASVSNKSKKPTYKRISSSNNSARIGKNDRPGKRPKRPTQPDIPVASARQIGITLWQIKGNTPERVSIDTVFKPFDRVRLSVETSRRGYIYIINQELRNDETVGSARLIFPSLQVRNGSNLVVPGNPIEIPNLNGSPFYFEFRPTKESAAIAEMLVVIITDQPIPGVAVGSQPSLVSEVIMNNWRRNWAGRAEIFEATESQKLYTQKERLAAAGSVSLTGDDPLPQTVFMIEANRNSGSLITVPLWYDLR